MVGKLEALVVKVRLEAAARQVCLRSAGRTIEVMMCVLQLFSVVDLQREATKCRDVVDFRNG